MAKLLDGIKLTFLWKLVKQEFSDSITRIFWDSSSEIFMYDTMGRSNNDFPIQSVKSSGTKPGLMTPDDKKNLDEVANFNKATTNPQASHPFAFDYCKLMDVDIVMTVGNKNLWCVTVLLNDTEDQTYLATYKGQVLARKQYNYQHTNMPQGDITTWFISLPASAEQESCVIGVS